MVSRTECGPDASSVVSVNTDSTVPASSPPPSYERVLEESRLQRSMTDDEEAIEESTDEGEPVRKGPPAKKPPEIVYKSSKEFYRVIAKQMGITCKMSDNCRCLDCQSRYFDCGYDKYQDYDSKYIEQSDGGLSASTPMFVSEVMNGSCQLL
ncbi:uncharacterized protein LOC131670306 isoform X2 [Phymastichus coffea]|uniref:uncharacterized protein LOC131670306 isoform X2 n=1 Tax=Phymastichus coffea TaxID=108790 RepID=UPI00273C9EF4|nr:uncharacterized protein LOC131670306 isoform X2 [Phymastichus coffea]